MGYNKAYTRRRAAFGCFCWLVLTASVSAQVIDFDSGDYNRPNIPDKLTGPGGLHIKPGRQISFNHTMTDGGGFRWDFNYYLCVYRGTDQAYGGAMYLNVNSRGNVRCYNHGWRNETGDEIEIYDRYSHKRYGDRYRKGLKVFRRVKVYKDRPLARWMEIFHNPTDKPITVSVKLYSNFYSSFGRYTTSDGDSAWEKGDTGFVTKQASRSNAPSTMHIVADKRAETPPNVQKGSSYVNVLHKLTVPANDYRIICSFESQGKDHDKLVRRMKSFRAWKHMRDLDQKVRRKVVNFGRLSGYADIDLLRGQSNDRVFLANGDPILGDIASEQFLLKTPFGRVRLPAKRVIGMALATDKEGNVDANEGMKVLLVGGHLIRGSLPDQELRVALGSASLEIPFHHMAQWSFRVSKQRPEFIETPPPRILLRNGMRLPISPEATSLPVRTQLGRLQVRLSDVHDVMFDPNDPNACTVHFLSGSQLIGDVDVASVRPDLTFEGDGAVPIQAISRIVHTNEEPEQTANATLVLRKTLDAVVSKKKETVLSGSVDNESLTLLIEGKEKNFDVAIIKELEFRASPDDPVTLTTWKDQTHSGLLRTRRITLRMGEHTRLTVDANECRHLKRTHMTAPTDMEKEAAKWIEQLGHKNRQRREKATAKLKQMSKVVVPLLRKAFHRSRDPEVRARLEAVLEHFKESIEPVRKKTAAVKPRRAIEGGYEEEGLFGPVR